MEKKYTKTQMTNFVINSLKDQRDKMKSQRQFIMMTLENELQKYVSNNGNSRFSPTPYLIYQQLANVYMLPKDVVRAKGNITVKSSYTLEISLNSMYIMSVSMVRGYVYVTLNNDTATSLFVTTQVGYKPFDTHNRSR